MSRMLSSSGINHVNKIVVEIFVLKFILVCLPSVTITKYLKFKLPSRDLVYSSREKNHLVGPPF